MDHVRKKKRKKRFGILQDFFGEQDENFLADFNHPGVAIEQKEKANELFKALKQIPDKQQVAFTLHKLEGLSYKEIAEIMKTTLYAVESIMQRAKNNLKKELEKYYKNE